MPRVYLDVREFQERGYLQELNRRFLHPLGLALEVRSEECRACGGTNLVEAGPAGATFSAPCPCCHDGKVMSLGGIWDCREDLEGIYFDGEYADLAEKAGRVQAEWNAREGPRREKLGHVVQPIEEG